MESKARLLGHAIHPMLIVFPLGLLPTAVVLDVVTLVSHDGRWSAFAFLLIGGGVATGLVAAVFGLIDWLAIPSGTRAKTIGAAHGIGMVGVVALFTGSWLLRWPHPGEPGWAALGLSFAGVGLSLIAGWLGGELVERLGVGVSPGANANASSSLSERPAAEGAGRVGA